MRYARFAFDEKRVPVMKWLVMAAAGIALAVWWAAASAAQPPQPGDPAPDFALPDQNGRVRSLAEFRAKWLVLYFYPKNDTPGCTEQACAFRDDWQRLVELGAEVVGVSVDD
ncbi:MAG TPA: peroxiredoxin, partial [Burkholderiales bacterium]|nr:peroxiredoxin [Burkholderiales bacterium]